MINLADDKPIGKVVHYYDKIGVAIIKLNKKLAVGEKIKFVRNDSFFEQTVDSMEIEHGKLTEAKQGDEVGIKVDQTVKQGALVYSV